MRVHLGVCHSRRGTEASSCLLVGTVMTPGGDLVTERRRSGPPVPDVGSSRSDRSRGYARLPVAPHLAGLPLVVPPAAVSAGGRAGGCCVEGSGRPR